MLDVLEDTGKDIIDDSNEDPRVVRDIRGELNKLTAPLDVVARKINDRQAKLQSVLLQCQEFQVSFDDFLENLDDLETKVSSQEPISAVLNTVRKQKQDNEAVQDGINQQQPVVEKLLKAGEAVLENLDDEQEKEALKKKIEDMKERFEKAKQQTDDRQNKLETVENEAQKYRADADSLSSMLASAEEQVSDFAPLSSDKPKLAKQREILEDILKAAENLKSDVPQVKDSVDALKDDAEADVNVLEDEVDDLVKRIENLNAALADRDEQLTAVEQAAEDYHVTVAQVEDVFASAYDDVDAPALFGIDSDKAAEQLNKIKVKMIA